MPGSEKLNGTAQPNGSTQPEEEDRPLSLREAAEAAWDEVVEDAPDDDAAVADDSLAASDGLDDQGQPRDEKGRFVSKETAPGEADATATQPRDESTAPQPQDTSTQPQPGEADEAPAHWSAEHRQMFAKLPPEAKAFVAERVHATESDYQRKVQATVPAARFVESIAPAFNDPVVAGTLEQFGLSPSQAVMEWASVHKRMFGPDMRDKMLLLHQMAERMGIALNPAAVGQSPSGRQPGLTQAELNDPAIRWFADNVGRTSSEVQALRNEINAMRNAEANRANEAAYQQTYRNINSFADAVGQDGQRLHPHFDHPKVAKLMIDLFRADPNRDMAEAYEQAAYAVPEVRQLIAKAEAAKAQARKDADRAAQAARSNVRGRTMPVTGPNGVAEPQGLRAVLEATADEIGI